MATSLHTQLAQQALAFGQFDPPNAGTWKLIEQALTARNLFLAGWRLATIGSDSANLMYSWIVEHYETLLGEIRG